MQHMKVPQRPSFSQHSFVLLYPMLREPLTVHIFASSKLPTNQEHQVSGTGVLGEGKERKCGLSVVLIDWVEKQSFNRILVIEEQRGLFPKDK